MKAVSRIALSAIASLSFIAGCSKNSGSAIPVEKPIPVSTPQPSPAVAAAPLRKLPAPTQAEVQAAFQRVFANDFTLDPGRGSFIVGDFNGDGAEDIAFLARPAQGKLDEINSELANWIIQDADHAFLAPPGKSVVVPSRQARPQVQKGEAVLAIIHGFGPSGWRNPDARQAYVIKHGAAPFAGIAPSHSEKAIRVMKLPTQTDIILEVRDNKKGFLFWTGGAYAWHPSQG
ncbi:MAG TPA: hypothetical protein VFT65_14845 [Candidatus Angelobacter sp.]|nr:hypothetical protein [Candidatus Angelobacter sp.]